MSPWTFRYCYDVNTLTRLRLAYQLWKHAYFAYLHNFKLLSPRQLMNFIFSSLHITLGVPGSLLELYERSDKSICDLRLESKFNILFQIGLYRPRC